MCTASYWFRILSPPTERLPVKPIISLIANQTVVVGSNVSFECAVYSDLTPHFAWLRYYGPENKTQLTDVENHIKIVQVGPACHPTVQSNYKQIFLGVACVRHSKLLDMTSV